MGCGSSTAVPAGHRGPPSLLSHIPDNFHSLEQLQGALRTAGLESSNLIVGVDFTKSNEWTGKRSFGGRCLHDTSTSTNPYASIINIIGRTLECFDDDKLIPTYGFGSANTNADKVFSFNPGEAPCMGFQGVLARYAAIASCVHMAGPTTFAPIIRKACEITAASGGQYHILVIVADGQVTRPSSTAPGTLSPFEADTAAAIVEASQHALSIVLVGVGDGPWDLMQAFDDAVPARRFDNWQTVVAGNSLAKAGGSLEYVPPAAEAQFALDALQEVPDQYRFIQQLGLLGRPSALAHARIPVLPPPDGGGMMVIGGHSAPHVGGLHAPAAHAGGMHFGGQEREEAVPYPPLPSVSGAAVVPPPAPPAGASAVL